MGEGGPILPRGSRDPFLAWEPGVLPFPRSSGGPILPQGVGGPKLPQGSWGPVLPCGAEGPILP